MSLLVALLVLCVIAAGLALFVSPKWSGPDVCARPPAEPRRGRISEYEAWQQMKDGTTRGGVS